MKNSSLTTVLAGLKRSGEARLRRDKKNSEFKVVQVFLTPLTHSRFRKKCRSTGLSMQKTLSILADQYSLGNINFSIKIAKAAR